MSSRHLLGGLPSGVFCPLGYHSATARVHLLSFIHATWPAQRSFWKMPQYKLTYFDLRGLGEGARLIFHQAGVPFEDNRIKYEDWPALKPKTPFGQIPVLDVDGQEIAQTAAIYRYLGRKFGLAGKTPIEEALVDSIYDAYKDFFAGIKPYFLVATGKQEGDKAKLEKEVAIPARDKAMPFIQNFLTKSGSGFLVGKSLTWADLAISDSLTTCETFIPGFLDGYPELKKFVEHIREQPNIKKWIAERPKTPF